MNPIIIYHGNCPDGFGAAWSFWKKYGTKAEYIAANYGMQAPDVTGKDVYIVDFSFSREVTEDLARKAKSILILDHHKTAFENLNDLPYFVYDVNHSGAYLAWKHVFGEDNVPNLIKIIEDRDLWKWKLLDSELLLNVVDSYQFNFSMWDALANKLELESPEYERMLWEGIAISRYRKNIINNIIKGQHKLRILGEDIPAVNSPYFQSEIGATLCVGNPYSCVYTWVGDQYRFSLRSAENGGKDVAEIAKRFGGGGHRNAAGFSVKSLGDIGGN